MNIVIDSCVWSLVLRRKRLAERDPWVQALHTHVDRGDVIFLVGPILQELLDGLRSPADFERLLDALSAFPLLGLDRESYVAAARIRNDCRRRGIQMGQVDALIAAACIQHGCALLTADTDFVRIAEHADLVVLPPLGG